MTTAIKLPAVLFEPNPRVAQFELLASKLVDCTSAIPAPPGVLGELLWTAEFACDCADAPSIENNATDIAARKILSLNKTVASVHFSRASHVPSSRQ